MPTLMPRCALAVPVSTGQGWLRVKPCALRPGPVTQALPSLGLHSGAITAIRNSMAVFTCTGFRVAGKSIAQRSIVRDCTAHSIGITHYNIAGNVITWHSADIRQLSQT